MSEYRVTDLTKDFGPVRALDSVSLALEETGLHCLVGPNGSGKTTLIRALLSLTRPTDGEVHRPTVEVGASFQQPNFFPDLTVSENLDVFESLSGGAEAAWRAEIVESLRLDRETHRRAADLSGGFAKKLDLAIALIKRPRYLFVDEPLANLDDVSRLTLVEFLGRYSRDHSVVVSSHDVTPFADALDRLTIMYDGAVLYDGTEETLPVADGEALQEWYVSRVLEAETSEAPVGNGGTPDGGPESDTPTDGNG